MKRGAGGSEGWELAGLRARPLEVPLWEPFVIASGRVDATAAVLVEAEVKRVGVSGTVAGAAASKSPAARTWTGLGEAPTLAPVTDEAPAEMAARVSELARAWTGRRWGSLGEMERELGGRFPGHAVTRAGISAAIWDAVARACGMTLAEILIEELAISLGLPSGVSSWQPAATLTTDITLPIAEPGHMATLARGYWAQGFRDFKVKVGREPSEDVAALAAIATAVPGARFRLDANGGYVARDALKVLEAFAARGVTIACFEQPCAREDWAGMAEVTARSSVPVVADESFRGAEDLTRILELRAAHGVNLKLAKLGGPWAAMTLGYEARRHGLSLMAGAMVETRAGLATMAHVAAALEGLGEPAAWIDLDTAFLMRSDPFAGGWEAQGPLLTLGHAPGTGLRWDEAGASDGRRA
jgi:L-alanine-DL-glutamate epimerase-like enolase superfamily enzyme